MPAVASLEELKAVEEHLGQLKAEYPEAYADVVELFRRHRKVGYKNICKMMMGEATAEKLKGLE
ncbi:MAG: hypothetical protein KAR73_08210 [Spirochaetales bacterium]|jgi:hypothetical protein|nr:hypothetical protein [Spirochaetales bacterium]